MTTDSVNTRELILEILLEVTERGTVQPSGDPFGAGEVPVSGQKRACLFNESGGGHHSAPDRTGLYSGSVLKSKGQKNETGDPRHSQDGRIPAEIYGQCTASAACNEAVKLAKKKGFGTAVRFRERGTARCFARSGSAYISRGERRCRKSLVGVLLDAGMDRCAVDRRLRKGTHKRDSCSVPFGSAVPPSRTEFRNGSRRSASQSVLRRRALPRFRWIRKNIPDFRMHIRSLGLII